MSIKNQTISATLGAILLTTHAAVADHKEPEQLLVIDSRDRRAVDVADTVEITADSSALLRKAPGANVNGNGPLTGIPQYRGMYGSRISVEVNGMNVSSGGPNWMDPPLSYAPAAQLETLEVYRGIAPVSVAQESIGGAIKANTWSGDFASGHSVEHTGRIRVGGQSVDNASLVSAAVVTASRQHRLKISGLSEQGDDAKFAGGDIVPSEYQRQRLDIGYGYQQSGHIIQLDIARSETGDTGTAALPMDIGYIDGDLASVRYQWQGNDREVNAKLYYSDIGHGMTNYELRQAPMMASMWRRNIATGESGGFKVTSEWSDLKGSWMLGIDGHHEVHQSDIDNPNNPAFFVVNFNDAERSVLGVFVERRSVINQLWTTETGLRVNRVSMDSGQVDGTPAMMSMMGMAPGMQLRDNFNQANREQHDTHIDGVFKLYYQADTNSTYYAGIARKSRSPSYQERYLWLPLQATAGLADGRTYTGNINLDPEVAHEIELGLDYSRGAFSWSPRIFYRHVDDYIQGTASTNTPALMFVAMMNTMNGTANTAPLEFNNTDAVFYGADMDWSYQLDDHWTLAGVVNFVRGKRDDVIDNLYRVAPPNTRVSLNYQASNWSLMVESELYARQSKVSAVNTEQKTAGYGLLNIKGYWQLSDAFRLGFGVDNVLDKDHRDHLAGYNRAVNADLALGARLPGYGRNAFARLDYQW